MDTKFLVLWRNINTAIASNDKALIEKSKAELISCHPPVNQDEARERTNAIINRTSIEEAEAAANRGQQRLLEMCHAS